MADEIDALFAFTEESDTEEGTTLPSVPAVGTTTALDDIFAAFDELEREPSTSEPTHAVQPATIRTDADAPTAVESDDFSEFSQSAAAVAPLSTGDSAAEAQTDDLRSATEVGESLVDVPTVVDDVAPQAPVPLTADTSPPIDEFPLKASLDQSISDTLPESSPDIPSNVDGAVALPAESSTDVPASSR